MFSRQNPALALLDLARDAIIVRDSGDKIIFWNRGAERTYGWTEEEALGQITHDLLKTRFHLPLSQLNSQLTEIENWEGELIQTRKDEQEIRVDSRWTIRREPSGCVTEILEINRDIPSPKRTEQAVRESEQRLRAIFDGTHEYIGLLRPDGTLLEANRASLAFANIRRDEVVGLPFWETIWFRYTPGAPEFVRQAIQRAVTGEFVRWESPIITPSGRTMTFDISLYPIHDEKGEVVLIVPEGRDITERKLAEETLRHSEQQLRLALETIKQEQTRLQVILANLPVGVIITDGNGSPLMVNQALKDIWRGEDQLECRGANHRDETLNVETEEFFKPETWPVSMALSTGELQIERAMDFLRLDGTSGVMRVAAVPIKDEQGAVVGGVAVGQDITELLLAEEERARLLASEQELRAQAEEANRLKDEFLAVTSHELRTPLSAIVGWTTILRSGKVDQELLATGLEVIQRNALSQSRMIEELLDVSSIAAGKIVLDYQLLEIPSIIADAVNSVRPVADAKDIIILTDICPDAGRLIGDANRLQQVLCNLLSNSVKFTPNGGRITVAARRIGFEVELLVRDSGNGIEPSFLPHVFEPFRQAGTGTTSAGGLGLGLAIVRHLVELHGGSVKAHSEGIGLGAVFSMRFPAAEGMCDQNSLVLRQEAN